MLPWAVPITMMFVGLVLVTTGLTDAEEPIARDVAPANVRNVFTDNAQTWATAVVGPETVSGIVTEIDDVVMVGAQATGASTYTARAVIIRIDSRALPVGVGGGTVATLAETDTSTVATCVLWEVDVSAQTFTPRGALEIDRRTGRHDLTDGDDAATALRDQCKAVGL